MTEHPTSTSSSWQIGHDEAFQQLMRGVFKEVWAGYIHPILSGGCCRTDSQQSVNCWICQAPMDIFQACTK